MTTLLSPTALKSSTPEVLREVRRTDCSLAIWERAPLPAVDQLLETAPSDVRFTAPIAGLRAILVAEMEQAGFPTVPARDDLADDIAQLAELYCSIIEEPSVEVRIEFVTTDSCRKWHADYVTARLITTYAGRGTDWLDGADADRVAKGLEPTRINTLSAGDVGVFKGKLVDGEPAIHRSPPIAGTGERRLLVVLNPPAES
ncbi:MAG: DUF1826 domain-containing protein [Erythrobacter sp.]|nr:DUF1826 domain-containing protein [Erythrobacter sp.]